MPVCVYVTAYHVLFIEQYRNVCYSVNDFTKTWDDQPMERASETDSFERWKIIRASVVIFVYAHIHMRDMLRIRNPTNKAYDEQIQNPWKRTGKQRSQDDSNWSCSFCLEDFARFSCCDM